MSTRNAARSVEVSRLVPIVGVVAVAGILSVVLWVVFRGEPVVRAPVTPLPSPSPIPSETFELEQVGSGAVRGWAMSEALVGPRDVAVDADGTVWITEQNRGVVDTFADGTLERHLTNEFPGTGAYGLAAGPGGMWFTAYPGGTIGRVLDDGTANVFDAVVDYAATLGIAEGPGHVMWVTDVHRSVVLRIRADGDVRQLPVPPVGKYAAAPRDIVRGSDGAMWFTDPRTRTIGRIATEGQPRIDQYPMVGVPSSIASGPDGSLWVTLLKTRSLGRVDVSDGSVDVIPLVDATGAPSNLAVGDDGSIWVTQASREVLHVGMDGTTIARYRLPGGATYADGIAIAPDGVVWVAASDANMIVAIRP